MPQQRKNENSLCQAQQNDANDVLLIGLPKGRLSVEHDTPGRECAFSNSPTLQCSPIEHIDIGVFHDGYVLWLFPFENPNGEFTSNPAFVPIGGHVPTHCPLANKRVLHDKNRGIRGADHQRKGLSFINEAGAGGILRDRGVEDNRMFGKPPQLLEERGHFRVGEIGELEPGFVTVQLLPGNGHQGLVIRIYTTPHHNHVPSARLQLQRRLEGLCRLHDTPRPGKAGVELHALQLVFDAGTNDDGSVRAKFFA